MRQAILACVLVLLAVPASGAEPQVPQGWKFELPAGDATTGKMLYEKLECFACHKLAGFPPPSGRAGMDVGPDLTGYGKLPAEYLADSIIDAHSAVAAPGYVMKGGKAGMGNYNHFLTVQELIDLVAFLRTAK
ncbi:MAG: c-type cytochrome [Thermodesulfobacteriota bacterium]